MRIIEISEAKQDKIKSCIRKMKNFLCDIEEALDDSSMGYRDERDEDDDDDYGYRRGVRGSGRGGSRGMGRY